MGDAIANFKTGPAIVPDLFFIETRYMSNKSSLIARASNVEILFTPYFGNMFLR
ncbi:hypothetical protein [Pinibacter aurantiacus]|uniref:Uncharacterized protein n=1 Tax=Pinibacter aurantiacus TaxID=2851599 RepID=A0A9E2SEN4_9BACT|nr:hypothetical protein [Pinibacter aurantiacus]MBV4359255.1 hypothetical protein [Pinibacter aurantiacus]